MQIRYVNVPRLDKWALADAVRIMRRERVRLVYANNTHGSSRIAFLAAKCCRLPFICHVRGMKWDATWSALFAANMKPVLEILAGIPSVVLGFFALTFISPEIVQRISGEATQFNIAAAGIGVGLCSSVIPYVSDQLAMARLPRATCPSRP